MSDPLRGSRRSRARYSLPDPEKVKQTVAKLRQTRLELEEFGLELAEINTHLEQEINQKRLDRLQKRRV